MFLLIIEYDTHFLFSYYYLSKVNIILTLIFRRFYFYLGFEYFCALLQLSHLKPVFHDISISLSLIVRSLRILDKGKFINFLNSKIT